MVIGSGRPLVDGLVDDVGGGGHKSLRAEQSAAQLEGSKGFTKDICAKYRHSDRGLSPLHQREPALAYLREQGAPIVVKADGLAAGKGVTSP